MAKTLKPATEITEIADAPAQEPGVIQEPLPSEGSSDQTDTSEEDLEEDLQEEKPDEPVPNVDPTDQSIITGEHHTFDKAREEITEYNQEVEKGNIPSDSTDVSFKQATDIVQQLAKLGSNGLVFESDSNDEPADHPEWDDYEDEAEDLMDQQNIKEIWRCPVTGYWFSKKVYAEEQEKKTGRSLEHYKN